MGKTLRNQPKIKDEQIHFLLGNLEKSLERYRESLENKDKQLAEAKRTLLSAKQSFDKVSQEKKQFKAYINQINQYFQLQQQQQHSQNRPKKYKKVILEEESENESDIEYEQDSDTEKEAPEEIPQIKKPRKKKSTTNVFDYINGQDAKRHKL